MNTTKNPDLTNSLSARDLRTSVTDNRYTTPVKLRNQENKTQTGTQISQMSQISQMNSGILSRSSSLCNLDNKNTSMKSSTPLLELSILKELGKDPIVADDEKSSARSYLKVINKDDFVAAAKLNKIQLRPLDGKRRGNNSVQKSDRNKYRLSPLDMRQIRDDFQKMNTVNRDISVTMEPIASDSYRKLTQVNKSIARKAVRVGSVDSGPRSEFEEQVLESMNQRFMWFKLQNEIKVIKPFEPDRFVIGAREEVYFKLRSRGLRYPLKGKVDISGKTPHCIFEILVSSTAPRPRRNNCEKRYIGRNFNIEVGSKVEWIYFTLAALTDLDITLTISPSMNNKKAVEEEESLSNDVPIYLKESYKLGLNKKNSNKDKLYPYLNYTHEQMANFYAEIKRIKVERKEKYMQLARGGRDIIDNNKSQVWIWDKSYMLEQIQNSSRKRDESIDHVNEKRDHIDYKDKIRRFFVMNREEFRHNVREEMDITQRRQEKVNKKCLKWFQILLRRLVLYELAQRIHNARAEKLLWRIKNRKITVIQRAFRKHMRKVAESYYLRKVKSIKEALNANSLMTLKNVKKKAGRLLANFLNEWNLLKDININFIQYSNFVLKIQKMFKRLYFIRHFQRVCLNMMIENMLGIVAEDRKKEREEKDKEKKKLQRENTKKKSKYMDKESEKEREKTKKQFDSALQINKDFRIFVAKMYQRKIMKQYLKKFKLYNDNLASPVKIEYPKDLERQDSEMQMDFSLSISASPSLSQKGTSAAPVKKKLLSLETMKSKKPTLSRASSMNRTKTLEFQAKKVPERIKPTLRFINKEALVAFMDEKFMSIVRKAKQNSNLSWLFQ